MIVSSIFLVILMVQKVVTWSWKCWKNFPQIYLEKMH